jgi:outer membrane protein assembly factor BamB
VLATTDGVHFTSVVKLRVPVRYPAVVADGGMVYAFGGEISATGSALSATDVIQRIDPATHTAVVVGHLPQPLYGAAAFVIGGTVYVAGGQIPGGPTLTHIDAFVPSTGTVLNAGLLPQAEAFGGYTTVPSAHGAIGYIVGGEVAAQAGIDQAGVASGSLQTVISLRLSPYGGPAGTRGAGSPYSGTLLVADRGNDRLIALDTNRDVTWQYPSAAMPPPPGGFYFPDDAFFIRGGTGIISNQEDNHTIVEIGYPSGKILWQYGHPGQPGAAPGYLDQPDDAYLLKSGTITVADASNNRILFISPQGQVTGQIGNGADVHDPPTSIAYPNGDTPLLDGNVLVSEIDGSWIDEYTPAGKLVWTVHIPTVNYPSDPQQVGADLYLMTDYNPPAEGRALEFTRDGQVTWIYDALSGDAMLKKPSLAERLPNGLIMLNDDYRDRVVVIDPTTYSIVWQYGLTDVPGTAPGLVSIPDGFDNLLANGTTPTHLSTG